MRLPDMERNLVAKCGPQPGSVCLWRGWMPGTTGFVFSLERLATGAAGFILAGLLGVAVSAGAGRLMVTQEPVAIVVAVLLIVIGVLTVPLVLICTNALVARSVVLEVLEGSGQTRQDRVAFVKRNLKTLFLYALVIVGGILAALVLETLLVLIGAIPTVGPILFGLLCFPCVWR